jgi:class 3 adenylate cyclase
VITAAIAFYNHRAVTSERLKTEALLHNVLPAVIADRLKAGEVVADRFEAATVVFADLVGFTPRTEKLSPDRVVTMLDELFRRFDRHCDRLGLEKIRTIGDAYMAAAGIPVPRADHASAAAELALAMQGELADLEGVELRVGIHSGPVVAGVIGARKFAYDLWGDTVNTASRMESHGLPGRIQVTGEVQEALAERYLFEARGEIAVKGKGQMPVFLLVGRR